MTDSPTRTRLLREKAALLIGEANAVAYTGFDYSKRPGYPTRERVAQWNRELDELTARERCPACSICGDYVRAEGSGEVFRCWRDGEYVVQLEGVE